MNAIIGMKNAGYTIIDAKNRTGYGYRESWHAAGI